MNLLEQSIHDKNLLESLIPQKTPFVMVDTLHYYSETKITSGFKISNGNLFVQHGRFMAPGLIENMAQTVALHTGYKYYLANLPAPIGYIGAIKVAEITALPLIYQQLETTVEILHDILGITLVSAKIICEGKLIAQSEMKTALANQ